jgi:hypothetical protein
MKEFCLRKIAWKSYWKSIFFLISRKTFSASSSVGSSIKAVLALTTYSLRGKLVISLSEMLIEISCPGKRVLIC